MILVLLCYLVIVDLDDLVDVCVVLVVFLGDL